MLSELLNVIERASKEGYTVIFGMHPVSNHLIVVMNDLESEGIRSLPVYTTDTSDPKAEEQIIDFIKRNADIESYYAGGWGD